MYCQPVKFTNILSPIVRIVPCAIPIAKKNTNILQGNHLILYIFFRFM